MSDGTTPDTTPTFTDEEYRAHAISDTLELYRSNQPVQPRTVDELIADATKLAAYLKGTSEET